jgi:Uma2 family endonuclease
MREMAQAERWVTADELERMPEDGSRRELVRGELRRMSPAGARHGRIALRVGQPLCRHVDHERLGVAFGAETGFRLSDDTVRAPDAAFVFADRSDAANAVGFFPGAPDLAVEVTSPHDSYSAVQDKVLDWLDAGTRLVLVVDPERCAVTVHRARDDVRVLTDDDVIDGADVVPGWRLPLPELFGSLDGPATTS